MPSIDGDLMLKMINYRASHIVLFIFSTRFISRRQRLLRGLSFSFSDRAFCPPTVSLVFGARLYALSPRCLQIQFICFSVPGAWEPATAGDR